MSADIHDTDEQGSYDGEGTIQSISISDIGDFGNPALSMESISGFVGTPEWTISIDGANISAEAPFDDGATDKIETTPGTLVRHLSLTWRKHRAPLA